MESKPKTSIVPVDELLKELKENIFPYWMNKMVDDEHGGFYGKRNGHDALELNAPKAIILNTRILWTFANAGRTFSDQQYFEIADRAYDYIANYFFDKEFGGVYWMVDHQGNPLQAKKQVYAQAFAVYALAEYYLATKHEDSLREAVKLFHLIERYSFDTVNNGYLEAFDQQWHLLDDLRLSEKDANEKKTMNTHLHVLEAYTVLYSVWPDEYLKSQLLNLINLFKEKIINENFQYDLFFDEHWKIQSRKTSFGHDIEGSWLLCEAAKGIGDAKLLTEIENLAIKTVDKTIKNGIDRDGGLMNEIEPGKFLDSDKHWWPQVEAMVGLVNAWGITSDELYLKKTNEVWSFIRKNLIDHKNGEWYWMVDRNGEVNYKEEKAGPWKCPYHNGRGLMEVIKRLR